MTLRRVLWSILTVLVLNSFVEFAYAAPCGKEQNSYHWAPPAEGLIRDSRSAISVAHAVWASSHPELSRSVASVEEWQVSMSATLVDNEWEVTKRLPKDAVGGAVFILISRCNAEVLNIYMTQ